MDRFVDKLIKHLENSDIVKSVFTVSYKNRYDDEFKELVNNSDYQIADYKNDVEDYLCYFKKHFPSDFKNSKRYSYFNKTFIENKPIDPLDGATLEEAAYCKILLLLFVTQGCIEVELNLKEEKGYNVCYRGHSNNSYDLLPSMYRGLKYNGIIDYNKLNEMYGEARLIDKYSKHIESIDMIDYKFISYMQHAISYSPLLDFSKDREIAMIFATSPEGKNYNSYSHTDAELYTLYLKDVDSDKIDYDSLLRDYRVQYYEGKLNKLSTIFERPLIECGLNDFSVELRGFIEPTNDRMKYQKGVFLFLKKAVFVNGTLFFPYSLGYITKSRIPCEKNCGDNVLSKEKIYNKIVSDNPSIDLEHLLNPYQAFAEYTNS